MGSFCLFYYSILFLYLYFRILSYMARRQRSTNNQNSNNQSQNNVSESSVVQPSATIPLQQEKKNFWEKFNNAGGIATVIIGIFAAGFAVGTYYESVSNRIEKMESEMNHQKEIEAIRKEKYMTKEDMEEFINNYNKVNNGNKK